MSVRGTCWVAMGTLVVGMLVGAWLAPAASQRAALADHHEAGKQGRIFEMRTYTTRPGLLKNLHERFRDHTNYLFVKHGMSLVAYWTPTDKPDTLVYVLAYPSMAAREKAWNGFRDDPVWQAAFKGSRERAGGSLLIKGGVVSQFLKATDYSPLH
jgi:hypothetical protein